MTAWPGSSPRVRGKPGRSIVTPVSPGLIPARAGKTDGACPWWGRHWAHPRACGENPPSSTSGAMILGSSPRVRGKRARRGGHGWDRRLIPARAGKTHTEPRAELPRRAHPRACGENPPAHPLDDSGVGSSPRVRGKHLSQRLDACGTRLIPARAGKTTLLRECCQQRWAHPRACGENGCGVGEGRRGRGSSPRVRGKRHGGAVEDQGRGLIPARAGKTALPPVRRCH